MFTARKLCAEAVQPMRRRFLVRVSVEVGDATHWLEGCRTQAMQEPSSCMQRRLARVRVFQMRTVASCEAGAKDQTRTGLMEETCR